MPISTAFAKYPDLKLPPEQPVRFDQAFRVLLEPGGHAANPSLSRLTIQISGPAPLIF